jgi:bleomycin hydrolase
VSEKGFSFANGIAINPEITNADEVYQFESPCPEVNVSPEIRQKGYESFVTTDDHLMHITGTAKGPDGTTYYITKNSWGTERNAFDGYLIMSESFVRAKTIYIMLHKDAIPEAIKTKLGI